MISLNIALYSAMSAFATPPEPVAVLAAIRADLPKLHEIEQRSVDYDIRIQASIRGARLGTGNLKVQRTSHSGGVSTLLREGRFRYVLNEDCVFGVERAERDGLWKLAHYSRVRLLDTFKEAIGEYQMAVYPLTTLGRNITMDEFLAEPSLQATSATYTSDGMIDLNYTLRVSKESQNEVIQKGILTISPKENHIIVRKSHSFIGSTLPVSSSVMFTRELDRSGDDLRCGSVKLLSIDQATKAELLRYNCTYSNYSDKPTDPKEFTPEFYQIPTPDVAPEDIPPARWPWWAGAGVVCIALSVLLRALARRRGS